MSDIQLNIKGLEQIIKALKVKAPTVKIGILGAQARAPAPGQKVAPTNAEIGARHEFGTSKMPQRSFLRIPLSDNLNKAMEASGALDKDVIDDVIADGSLMPWMQKIAVLAEGIVAEAFDSGGFGKWVALKPQTLRRKKVLKILIESQQLRNSITSEVR